MHLNDLSMKNKISDCWGSGKARRLMRDFRTSIPESGSVGKMGLGYVP